MTLMKEFLFFIHLCFLKHLYSVSDYHHLYMFITLSDELTYTISFNTTNYLNNKIETRLVEDCNP